MGKFARRSRSSTALRAIVAGLAILASMANPALAKDPLPVSTGHATAQPPVRQTVTTAQTTTQFGLGDVLIGVGNGQIQWRHPDGTLNATLDTGLGGFTT